MWKPILPARAHPLEPSPILALADGADPTLGPQARYSYLREEIVKYERTYKAMHGGALPTKKQYDPLVYKVGVQ